MSTTEVQGHLTVSEIAAVIETEYIDGFIKDGGAAVKFYVSDSRRRSELCGAVSALAEKHSYLYTHVNGTATRLQSLPEILFAITKQTPWQESVRAFLMERLATSGLRTDASDLSYEKTAYLNGQSEHAVKARCSDLLANHLHNDYRLAIDFRLAMSKLCRHVLDPDEEGSPDAKLVTEWLVGDLRYIVTLRGTGIHKRINKNNARSMFASLAIWLRKAGYSGLLLTIDISRVLQWKRGSSGSVYYTRRAALDAYEILRQFIDEAEELESTFISVLAPPDFLFDDSKGLNSYDALRFRLSDDAHDRRRPNPLAPMLRIA